jgi:glucokinase
MPTLLAGDIGGTKTLLSLYRWDGHSLEPRASARYPSAEWEDLAVMVNHFLASPPAEGVDHPAAACLAVAGPVRDGEARLTNLPWRLNGDALAAACSIPRLELVNDFVVLIHGLPHLQPHQLAPLRPGLPRREDPVLIVGAGTGLGVAMGIPSPGGLIPVATEAGHAGFAPRSQAEWDLREWLRHDLGLERVSLERIVSGSGLGHVARWLLACHHPDGDHPLAAIASRWHGPEGGDGRADLPAAVSVAAREGDGLALEALHLWVAAYGAAVGDLALDCLCRGGIWLAGGTAAKLLDELRSDRFIDAFLAKGRLRPALEPIPIQAAIDPELGSFSAACRARMLLA